MAARAVSPHACPIWPTPAKIDASRRTTRSRRATSRQLFEAVGVDQVVALDVHNLAAFENAFRCPTLNIEAAPLFVEHFAASSAGADYAVVSPDIGGAKRAHRVRDLLEFAIRRPVTFALMDKVRSAEGVSGTVFAGDVAGRRVIVVDDLISSGTTVLRAMNACRRAGAARVEVAATHASFSAEAQRLFESDGPDSVVVTDSVTLGSGFACHTGNSLTVLDGAALFAHAIRALEPDVYPACTGKSAR